MIDELPAAPDPAADSPTEFSAKAAAFVLAQRALPGQMNAAIAEFGALAAGGAYSFPFVFDSATADADPGPGELRLSSATQNAATTLRIDVLTQGGASISGVLDMLQSVTSAIKGSVRIVKSADPSKWLLFDVAAVGAGAGYRNMTVVHRAGSAASPFANGEALMVYIDRNGDAGTVPGATELLATIPVTPGSFTIGALNVFRSEFDFYEIQIDNLAFSVASGVSLQVAVAGVVQSGTSYSSSAANTTLVSGLTNAMTISSSGSRLLMSGTIEISGTNGTTGEKAIGYRNRLTANASNGRAYEIGGGSWQGASAISGFQISSAQTMTAGVIYVYGRRKQ